LAAPAAPLATYAYFYDRAGNRTQANETVNGTATVTTWIYDLADRLLRETRYSGTEIIVGSRIADTSFTYDARAIAPRRSTTWQAPPRRTRTTTSTN
jgi:YD repeat-containing protein